MLCRVSLKTRPSSAALSRVGGGQGRRDIPDLAAAAEQPDARACRPRRASGGGDLPEPFACGSSLQALGPSAVPGPLSHAHVLSTTDAQTADAIAE